MEKSGFALHVLLIEDDPFQREIIREYLEIEGRYEVHEAKGVHHALAMCEYVRPRIDVVLIDMKITTLDMVELLLAIRERRPDMAILGVTDRPVDYYEEPRLRTSRAGFIPSLFTPHHLNRSIQAVIRAGSPNHWRRTPTMRAGARQF